MSRILRRAQVCDITGLSYSSIYRLERSGRFPQRVKLTDRLVGWHEEEILQWKHERSRASRP
ncbi:helix-turn-helix transcriptional regulator [Candidatus Eisenbacteria bacterium]|uniref:Helix-turn-helix transcriptional regulator n=1 Tax=Eiseniibacteriota bacterium TaxID=2212470 RepID=A0ABV6YKG2_UNCEI